MSPSELLLFLDGDEVRATTPYFVRVSAACIDHSSLLISLQFDGRVTDIVSVSICVAVVAASLLSNCCVGAPT